jgi:hypothetical protein
MREKNLLPGWNELHACSHITAAEGRKEQRWLQGRMQHDPHMYSSELENESCWPVKGRMSEVASLEHIRQQNNSKYGPKRLRHMSSHLDMWATKKTWCGVLQDADQITVHQKARKSSRGNILISFQPEQGQSAWWVAAGMLLTFLDPSSWCDLPSWDSTAFAAYTEARALHHRSCCCRNR